MAQSVERPTSTQVMISRFVNSSPTSSSVLTAQNLEPASDSVSPSLSLPLPYWCSVFLSKINIKTLKKEEEEEEIVPDRTFQVRKNNPMAQAKDFSSFCSLFATHASNFLKLLHLWVFKCQTKDAPPYRTFQNPVTKLHTGQQCR